MKTWFEYVKRIVLLWCYLFLVPVIKVGGITQLNFSGNTGIEETFWKILAWIRGWYWNGSLTDRAIRCGSCLCGFGQAVRCCERIPSCINYGVFRCFSQNLRKATILASPCMSVCVEQLGSYWTDFQKILYLRGLKKSTEIIQVSLKPDKNKGYFTWRRVHIFFYHISLISP